MRVRMRKMVRKRRRTFWGANRIVGCWMRREVVGDKRLDRNRFEGVGFGHIDNGARHGTLVSFDIVAYLKRPAKQDKVFLVDKRTPVGLVGELDKYMSYGRDPRDDKLVEDVRRDFGVGNDQLIVQRIE